MPYLQVKDLSIAFDTREGRKMAVDQVSFEVEKGEVLGVVGESGSGKSVACYSLMGLLPMPPAKVLSGSAKLEQIELLELTEKQFRSVRGSRISMIFQDPMTSLNPYMTIGDQLIEPLVALDKVSKKEARSRAIQVLDEVGIVKPAERLDSYPHEFSGGMRQRVMIAMALIKEPDVLIADEPTTALDVTVQAQILSLIQSIQARRQLTVIFISHDLAVVADLADKIIVMEKGRVVESGLAQEVLHNPQVAYTQKLVSAIPKSAKPDAYRLQTQDEPLLVVNNVVKEFNKKQGWAFEKFFAKTKPQAAFRAVDQISMEVREGEILGLVGESGSGKSTLGRTIIRLLEPDQGTVNFAGRSLTDLSPGDLQKARKSFQMIFQDPYASLNPRMTVFDILAEPMKVHKLVPKLELVQAVNQLMNEVGLSGDMIRKYPHEFSGGQRQRIAIARAIAMKPRFIVADEPVSALDVTIQKQILQLLLDLTKKYQLAMLFISHDLSVVRFVSDRVMVMRHGKVVEEGETEQLFLQPQHEYTKKLLGSVKHL